MGGAARESHGVDDRAATEHRDVRASIDAVPFDRLEHPVDHDRIVLRRFAARHLEDLADFGKMIPVETSSDRVVNAGIRRGEAGIDRDDHSGTRFVVRGTREEFLDHRIVGGQHVPVEHQSMREAHVEVVVDLGCRDVLW